MRVEWTGPDEARVRDNARGHVKRYAMVAMATQNSIPLVESNIRRARSRTRFLKNCTISTRGVRTYVARARVYFPPPTLDDLSIEIVNPSYADDCDLQSRVHFQYCVMKIYKSRVLIHVKIYIKLLITLTAKENNNCIVFVSSLFTYSSVCK